MPKFCSQCGITGHNKRNRLCRVNLNERKYQSITEEIDRCQTPDQKLDLLDNTITGLLYQFDASKREYSLSLQTADYYGVLVQESRSKWISAQQNRSMEETTAAYDELCCAIKRLEIMRQHFVSATLLKSTLKKLLERFIMMERVLLRSLQKHTSNYLKELTLFNDLTLDSEATCECPLCYDTVFIADALHTNCAHSYCVECVKGLATSIKDKTTQPTCPCCRTIITEIKSGNDETLTNFRSHLNSL
jgi:hypothetical protein